MAQVTLSAIGSAIGGPVGGAIGSFIGAQIDRAAINSLTPARQLGPRIPGLRIQSTGEGAPVPCLFGRARISGQVIWAARFKERRIERRTGGGKGGGPKTVEYRYSLSFAVGLCEGPIDGIGRVWADGKPLDLTGVTMRVHTGAEDQTPDALIEAVEGEAPGYRGLAYVVFEDLALGAFGNRPPQLSFEVFRRPRREGELSLEDRLKGVCLIPGAGEFVLATDVVQRRDGITRITAENVNNTDGRTDLVVSLDHLQAQLPNVEEVMLVVSWFGTSLSCGECLIRPGVEQAAKATIPLDWRAGGVDRSGAHLISTHGGGPAYGGTPSDRAVLQAIAELKARGLKVGLYPFILMDAAGYPWRGRMTCAPGTDKTAAVAGQVGDFFGTAVPDDFFIGGGDIGYSGPGEWGLRRMVLHYARLAAQAGGVDTFLIGSELRGVTCLRTDTGAFPAVDELRDLAAGCRSLLGGATAISYAADWSEYFGCQPQDGTGDVFFHLDPLWADGEIDFVGVDYYPPLADWRDGTDHLDAALGGPHEAAYIDANIEGGEGFDWYYASEEDREAQTRTPITDGAYGEPWVFRPKDLRSWWGNAHHDRPGGVRSGTPTAWTPGSKPIRLIEFGCPAVDKGANSPNLFVDPKSDESSLPPFSDGTRGDYGQRIAVEAVLAHWADEPMIEAMSAWCWDARPFPDFPARSSVWADAPNWALGHWLTGRAGVAPVADLAVALAARAGVEIDPGGVGGVVTGYVVDRPMRLRDALAPLAEAFAFDGAERGGLPTLIGRDGPALVTLDDDDFAWPEDREAPRTSGRALTAPLDVLALRFIDETADYQTGALTVRRDPAGGGDGAVIDLPMTLAAPDAERIARRILSRSLAARDETTAHLSPLAALKLEAGDMVSLGDETRWRVLRIDLDEQPRAVLEAAEPPQVPVAALPEWTPPPPVLPAGPPVLHLLDLPPLNGSEDDARPLAAVAADPWRAMDVHAGAGATSLSVRARASQPAAVGETLSALPAGPLHRIDRATALSVRVEGLALESQGLAAVLGGANALAVLGAGGEWEIVQFLDAEATGDDAWMLTGLLRGQSGSDPAMAALTEAGAPVVVLGEGLERADVSQSERGLPLMWRAAPAGGAASGSAMTEANFTWRALALRPWSPAHLRIAQDGGDLAISWIRRARVHGDGWDDEPPLSEEAETWRVEILDSEAAVRTAEVSVPAFTYDAAMQADDFPGGLPSPLTVRVRQGSAVFGWGAPAVRAFP